MTRWLWVSLALVGCSSSLAVAPPTRRPDGGWHLKCGASLEACVQHASQLCKDRGFVVLGGMSKRKVYGAELGTSQVVMRDAELDVACADRSGDLPEVASGAAPAGAPAPVAPVAEHTVASAHVTACTPGSTQRCVGAGACAGGQACLADGSGYAACDCGMASAAVKAP